MTQPFAQVMAEWDGVFQDPAIYRQTLLSAVSLARTHAASGRPEQLNVLAMLAALAHSWRFHYDRKSPEAIQALNTVEEAWRAFLSELTGGSLDWNGFRDIAEQDPDLYAGLEAAQININNGFREGLQSELAFVVPAIPDRETVLASQITPPGATVPIAKPRDWSSFVNLLLVGAAVTGVMMLLRRRPQ